MKSVRLRLQAEQENKKMKDKAIMKITEEMMSANDSLAVALEEDLTNKIENEDGVAEKILKEGKNLKEIHSKIWEEAKKRKKGNCAYIPDEEVFRMVDEYYELVNHFNAPASNIIDITDLL